MILGYKVYTTAAVAQAQADALWERYSTNERAARGLPVGASLDRRAGVRVEPPITRRYVEIVTASGETRACMVIDAFAAALHGVRIGATTMDTTGYVDASALPTRLRDKVAPEPGTAGALSAPSR